MGTTILESAYEEGIRLGRLEARRWCLHHLLEIRFGTVPKTLADRINAMNNLDLLGEAMDRAVFLTCLDDSLLEQPSE